MLRALTLLIDLQLGLVPRARVMRMAASATTAAAAAEALAAEAAVASTAVAAAVSAADVEAPSGAALAAGSGYRSSDEVGAPCWRAVSDGAAWTRRQLLRLREPAVVLASLSLRR